MAENQTAKWTSTQAYVLSVICLLVGVAVGYLARGSASPQAGVGQVQASSAAAKGAAAQTPTPEQMRQMAESQAAPLLAQLKGELDEYHQTTLFGECHNMGDIVEKHIEFTLARHLG